jgi:hypothetical protein
MPEITTTAPATSAPAVSPAIPSQTTNNGAPVKTAEVNGNQDKLNESAGLRRQLRETTTKLTEATARGAELEKKIADFDQLRPLADKHGEVSRLLKEGKHVEAMKAAGVELEQAFAQWVEENENNPAPAGPSKELVELQAKYDAIAARLKGEDDEKTKATEDAKTKAAEQRRAGVVKEISDKIASDGARWVRCAKDSAEASETALNVVQEKAREIIKERAEAQGFDLSKLTAEQAAAIAISDKEADELFGLALDAVEAEYKALADKFHVPEVKRPASATVRPIGDYFRKDGSSNRDSSTGSERKVAVTLDGTRGSLRTPKEQETRGKLSAGDAKAKALASIRARSAR